MCCEPVLATGAPVDRGDPDTSVHLELAPELRAAKRAREFVAANAPPLTPASQVALRLLTSELVTNAVLHARTALQVGLTVTDDCVLVTVADRDLAMPEQQPYAPDRVGGRGLVLVDRLSDEWGLEAYEGGKTLWFTLRRPEASPNGARTAK
jgi:anti-sigma regulatory factor (Ser/Thr protein kinase)